MTEASNPKKLVELKVGDTFRHPYKRPMGSDGEPKMEGPGIKVEVRGIVDGMYVCRYWMRSKQSWRYAVFKDIAGSWYEY